MRHFSKLHGCAAGVILLLLYSSYQQRYIGVGGLPHDSREGVRLVVFGDEWSDTKTDRVSDPSLLSVAGHDRGDVWTETLCKELDCGCIDNFARPSSTVSDDINGASVNADTQSAAATAGSSDQTRSDFRTQVQQFLTSDKATRVPESLRISHSQTIFTVYFGFWDLLDFSTLELRSAMDRIDVSITEIFDQLDLLATHTLSQMRVVLPRMVDVTYLPRYQSMANRTREKYAELQQKGIFLSAYWNFALSRSASRWQKAAVFMPDPSDVALELLRVEQLPFHRVTGAHTPLSEHVDVPCLMTPSAVSTNHLGPADTKRCSNVVSHLFRDDLHFGAVAHQLIGKQAASLVHDNTIVNHAGASEGLVSEYIPEDSDLERFDLKYPPGY